MPSALEEWHWGFQFPQATVQFLARRCNSSCLRQKKLESQLLARWTPTRPALGTWSGRAVRARAATSKTGWLHQDPPMQQVKLNCHFVKLWSSGNLAWKHQNHIQTTFWRLWPFPKWFTKPRMSGTLSFEFGNVSKNDPSVSKFWNSQEMTGKDIKCIWKSLPSQHSYWLCRLCPWRAMLCPPHTGRVRTLLACLCYDEQTANPSEGKMIATQSCALRACPRASFELRTHKGVKH